jgi:hypothetical protein
MNTTTVLVANPTEPLDSPRLFLSGKPSNAIAKRKLVVLDALEQLSS